MQFVDKVEQSEIFTGATVSGNVRDFAKAWKMHKVELLGVQVW